MKFKIEKKAKTKKSVLKYIHSIFYYKHKFDNNVCYAIISYLVMFPVFLGMFFIFDTICYAPNHFWCNSNNLYVVTCMFDDMSVTKAWLEQDVYVNWRTIIILWSPPNGATHNAKTEAHYGTMIEHHPLTSWQEYTNYPST